MLTTLEKYWPYLSILLLLLLLAVPFAWPGATVLLGAVAVSLGVGTVILFSVHGHVKAHREGQLDRADLVRNIAVDVPGLEFLCYVINRLQEPSPLARLTQRFDLRVSD